ncbi:MAG: acyltransferase family protein [Dechloromonas sp.]|nr:acyltransferase family protein [Dechloromonas sp.]
MGLHRLAPKTAWLHGNRSQGEKTPVDHVKYRPDIDGLRAIAVLSVVAFHAFPKVLKGGFVGVDIFFVISGFLISSIILSGLEHQRFSFIEFYSRRIRRIFPALLTVLTASLALGWFVLLAEEYQQLGKHVAGGAAFVSNLVLWGESGYFDNDAETKPLLHLWSLGIEEQFYIVWPLLLWLAWRLRFSALWSCLLLAALSFGWNMALYRSDPVADFYSPLTRFWELLAGALLAYRTLVHAEPLPVVLGRYVGRQWTALALNRYRTGLSIAGLLFIVLAVVITKQKHFPGQWAVLSVWGAVMLISAGPTAWANRRVLSRSLLVWIGLISFPLYLWHWPILSFLRIIEGDTPDEMQRLAAICLTFILAWLTYRGVERPLRFGGRIRRKTFLLLASVTLLGIGGWLILQQAGLPSRSAARPDAMLEGDIGHTTYHRYVSGKYHPCQPDALFAKAMRWDGYVRCLQSQADRPVDVALIGDSHAEHLFLSVAEQLPSKNVAFYIRAEPPFVDSPAFAGIYEHVLASPSIKQVILTMYWAKRIGQLPAEVSMEKEMRKTIDALVSHGKSVFLTDDNPLFPFDPMKCKVRRVFLSSQQCEMPRELFDRQTVVYGELLAKLQQDPAVHLIETAKVFCNSVSCAMNRGTELLFRDRHHLNINGSKYLGEQIAPVLKANFD